MTAPAVCATDCAEPCGRGGTPRHLVGPPNTASDSDPGDQAWEPSHARVGPPRCASGDTGPYLNSLLDLPHEHPSSTTGPTISSKSRVRFWMTRCPTTCSNRWGSVSLMDWLRACKPEHHAVTQRRCARRAPFRNRQTAVRIEGDRQVCAKMQQALAGRRENKYSGLARLAGGGCQMNDSAWSVRPEPKG
jgi:hypothetical protein